MPFLVQYNNYENKKLPEFNASIVAAETWLAAHPTPTGVFDVMRHRMLSAKVATKEAALEILNNEYQERLTTAAEMDRKCELKKAQEN